MKQEANKYFDGIHIDLGDLKHGDYPLFEFKCILNAIEFSKAECGGCTYPSVKKNGDVYGYIDINAAVGRKFENPSERNVGIFQKSVKVYLKDGRESYITNEKGITMVNPEKDFVELTIAGNVIN